MKDKHASTTNNSLKKNRLIGNSQVSTKRRGVFVPEDKRADEAITDRIRNSIRVSYIWIKQKMMREVLNYFCSVENVNWLCDKSRLFQSSNNFMSKFM